MSKNMAERHFDRVLRGKREFSTAPVANASDNAGLSRRTMHFCTFCVDKIVSNAAHWCPCHWFVTDKLPCPKTMHIVSSPGAVAARRRHESGPTSRRTVGSIITPEFCTSSVDKIVRNTMFDALTLWFCSAYFPCANFRHTKSARRKQLSVTKVSHSICG